MRMKQLFPHSNLLSSAHLVWSRITFSRLTTAYFIFAVLHCSIQVIIQSRAFSINSEAAVTLWSLVVQANQSQEANGFAVLAKDLRLCHDLPDTIDTHSCQLIWNDGNQTSFHGVEDKDMSPSEHSEHSKHSKHHHHSTSTSSTMSTLTISTTTTHRLQDSTLTLVIPTATPHLSSEGQPEPSTIADLTRAALTFGSLTNNVNDPGNEANPFYLGNPKNIDTLDGADSAVEFNVRELPTANPNQLSNTCIKTLIWPVQTLSNTKREDITLIGFQIWILGMSIVALLNESIQHVCAALVTHLLATMWTIFQVFQTESFRRDFSRVITHGACNQSFPLNTFWEERKNAEIISAVFNGVALLSSCFLTYKLIKIYGWQTFKRVGASLTINRVYKLVLTLSIVMQLGLFFIVSAAALWMDQLLNASIGRLASLGRLYKAGIIVMLCLSVPWFVLGWCSVRCENRKLASGFLAMNALFIGLWAGIFASVSFRWTFIVWNFFAFMAVAAGALMIIAFVLGVACRINFGKGLLRYLKTQQRLEDSDFIPIYSEKQSYDDDPEKVEFPSSNSRPIPTFSAAYGKSLEITRPGLAHLAPSTVSHQRQGSDSSLSSTNSLRKGAPSGMGPMDSQRSPTRNYMQGRRWVIE